MLELKKLINRQRSWRLSISTRWTVALLCHYACALIFMHRSSMSVAIVAMTDGEKSSDHFGNYGECAATTFNNTAKWYNRTTLPVVTKNQETKFVWDEELQGVVLGASFYLYAVVPPFAGRATDAFGGKWIGLVGLLVPCLLTALTPLAVQLGGVSALVILQTLNGGFMGLVYPAIFTILVKWFPLDERPSANGGMIVGTAVGSSLGNFGAGYLAASSWGWPLVFYALAAAHLPWLAGWIYFVSNQPEDNPRIDDLELEYILRTRKKTIFSKNIKAPWSKILTSVPVLALLFCQMFQGYGNFLLQAKTPSYLSRVFGISLEQTGNFSCAIFGALAFSSLMGAPLSNWAIHRYRHSVRSITIRRLFNGISFFGPALCVLCIHQLSCHLLAIVALLFVSSFLFGFYTAGTWPMASSMAPNFSGTIAGITLSLPFSMGFVAPWIAGLILEQSDRTVGPWNLVFYSYVAVFVAGGLIFTLVTDQQQEWDKIDLTVNENQVVHSQKDPNNNNNNKYYTQQ